jgi:tripartite-type tricarboxylate transporter receptor subunit TctC
VLNKRALTIFLMIIMVLASILGCGAISSEKTNTSVQPADKPADKPAESSTESAKPAFPEKNITFIVPVSPGGGFDTISRMFIPFWEKNLPNNAKIIVENKPGGEWNIGLGTLYKQKPDGYTVGMLNIPGNVVNQIMDTAQYDLTKYSWIGRVNDVVYVGAASKQSGIKTFEDLVAKKDIKVGAVGLSSTAGLGSVIAGERFGLNITTIPHDGSKEAILSALRGTVDYVQYPYGSLKKSIVDSDELTPIVVFADERLPELPNVPTVKELGYEDLIGTVVLHRGIAASPGVPDDILQILRESFDKAVKDPEFKQKMLEEGGTFNPANAKRMEEIVKSSLTEFVKYKPLLEKYSK